MPDPNARRDKALEGIARELGETNKLLKQIERNTRRTTFTNHPYLEGSSGQPEREAGEVRVSDAESGPYGSGPQPYV